MGVKLRLSLYRPSLRYTFIGYKSKNAQVICYMQICKKQGCCQAGIRTCSHCLFPAVVLSLEQVVITLLQGGSR